MKNTLLAVALAVAAGVTGMAPRANAATGDSTTFNMIRSAGATCLPAPARGRVSISDLGPVQNMHVEVFSLVPNTSFTLFVVQHAIKPFGLGWYQGDIKTDSLGNGVGDFTGIFSEETFIVSDTPVQMDHLGIWFADPTDAGNAGCANTPTPFDGDHVGGIQALNTGNFADGHGPLLRIRELGN
jgi:hypothetical protein